MFFSLIICQVNEATLRQHGRPAAYLGARPDVPGRADYLLFLTVSGIFLLGMLAFLRYINLDPVRERVCHVAELVAPGGRVATAPALEILG